MIRIVTTALMLLVLSGCDLILGTATTTNEEPMGEPTMSEPLVLTGEEGNIQLDSSPCASAEYTYEVSGGTPPYAFSLSAPNELNAVGALDMDGTYQVSVEINGAIGSWAMNVTVQDSTGATAEKMVVFANATAFNVTTSGDELVTTGESAEINAAASSESMTVVTEFAWSVQGSPMDSSLMVGSALTATTSGSNSSAAFTPDVNGDYEIGVTATQGACTATASFALRAREECTSGITLTTKPGKIQVRQEFGLKGTYNDPSGDETFQWQWTKPDGSQETLMVETFQGESGLVLGAYSSFTPMELGIHKLTFVVVDEFCEYTADVELEAAQQKFILDAPRTTFVIDSSGQDRIESRLQYGDRDSFTLDPSMFGGAIGIKTKLSLDFIERDIELAADCTSASGMGCALWNASGEAMGNLTLMGPSYEAVLITSGGGMGAILAQVAPSTRTVPTVYINDARTIPLIGTATKTFHFRHRQEVPYALYDDANNQFFPGEAAIREGGTVRLEITAGYFNAPLTFEISSNNPLLTLSSTTIQFPARSEGVSKSITLTAAQDMDVFDAAAVIQIRELNNAGFGDFVTGDYASYTTVTTQIHIQDDDRMTSCPMLSTTSCWADTFTPPSGAFYCDNIYRDRLAVNVTGGSGNYQFYFHQSDLQSFENLEGPRIPSYVDSVVGLSMSPEGMISEWVPCDPVSISNDPSYDIKRCEWDVIVVDQMTGCAIRHLESGTGLN